MIPKIYFLAQPDDEGGYVMVHVSVSGIADDDKRHYVRIYEQVHMQQELPDTMCVEQWLLAALANHVDTIRADLAKRINQGERTLMLDAFITEKDLVLGACRPPPPPARIGPARLLKPAARGLFFGFSPHSCE